MSTQPKVVKIQVVRAHDGYVSTALNETGGTLSEWFHPSKNEAIRRTKFSVFEKLKTEQVLFRVEG